MSRDALWMEINRDLYGTAAVWASARGMCGKELAERIKDWIKARAGVASTTELTGQRYALLWDRCCYYKAELGLEALLRLPGATPIRNPELSVYKICA